MTQGAEGSNTGGLGVAARQRHEEDQFKQFVIGQGIRPGLEEPVPQALTVPFMIAHGTQP